QTADDIQPPFERFVDRPLFLARTWLRVKERIDRPNSFLSRTPVLGIDTESNRKSAKRFPIHPLGELSTDSSVESITRVGQIRHTDLGQDDADHSPPLEPP